ncbi:unnamed protein product [Auanema sp. JU1783]|nr:unnamed protein product [Auanema sp. JU1783]
MRDRFADFQKTIDHFDEVELGTPRPQSAADRLDQRMRDVRITLDRITSELDSLKRKQMQILSLTVADPRDKDVLENQIATIRQSTNDLRKSVKEIDDEFLEFARIAHSNAEVRIRKNQIELLRRKLRDLMTSFHETHADYRSRVSVRVRRQLQAVGGDVSEEDINRVLAGNADKLFFREVNPLSISERATLEDAKKRHNEILELEKSIATLEEIAVDIQHLVETQGEMVDNIERNVEDTTNYVHQGGRNVKQAVEYKKSAVRKKICVITILIVIVLLLIVVAIILAVVLSGRK